MNRKQTCSGLRKAKTEGLPEFQLEKTNGRNRPQRKELNMINKLSLALAVAIAAAAAAPAGQASELVSVATWPEDIRKLESMLNAGVDPNQVSERTGWSALYAAAMMQNIEGVGALIEAGANVNFADPSSGMTALHLAAQYGDVELAALLIVSGANVSAKDNQCLTPYNHTGGNRAQRELLRALLEAEGAAIGRRC